MTLSAETYEHIVQGLKSDPPRESDGRRSPRVGVRSMVPIILMKAGRAEQHTLPVRDVSAGGIGILAPFCLPLDSQFLVQFTRAQAAPLTIACRVRHCEQIAANLYSVGALFLRQVSRADAPAEGKVESAHKC